MFGFVGDSTLRVAVAIDSPDGDDTTQEYCPASVERRSENIKYFVFVKSYTIRDRKRN